MKPTAEPAPLSILLIDDDKELCSMMAQFFAEAGHELHTEHDGPRGLIAAMSGRYHLVILDVMLPGFDGFTLLDHIRLGKNLPVVMLTARAQHRDRIHGLNSGADDYISKPFDPDELLARIHAVLRRSETSRSHATTITLEDLTIDFATRHLTIANHPVALTEKEFELLELLVKASGRVVSRDEIGLLLFERSDIPYDRILDVHVSHLRKKLGPCRHLIRTVRGTGYAFGRSA